MKKVTNIVLAIVMLAVMLCACGKSEESKNENFVVASESIESITTVVQEEKDKKQETTEEIISLKGNYTLEECKGYGYGGYGFYIMYPDGSLDNYYTGAALIKDGPRLMTYGKEYTYESLIIDIANDTSNLEHLQNGQLILYCPENTRIQSGLYPVEFSGCTISRINSDSKKEAVFFTKWDDELYYNSWVRGESIDFGGRKCETVNGIPMNAFGETLTADNRWDYISLKEGEKYTLSIVEGTALVEVEYTANQYYYIQKEDEWYDLKLIPTVDGYASVDFADVPEGEYVLYYSFWDETFKSRCVWLTHVVVNK